MATKTDLKRLGSRVDVVDHVEEGGSGRVFVVRSDVDPATPPPTSAELREWTGAGPGDAVVSVEYEYTPPPDWSARRRPAAPAPEPVPAADFDPQSTDPPDFSRGVVLPLHPTDRGGH